MGFFDFFKSKPSNGNFVSEASFNKNKALQIRTNLQTIKQLRKYDVTNDTERKLEYFFYTNTAEKAEQLATEIEKLNYSVKHGVSASDKNIFVVSGWTTQMKMSEEIINHWTNQMCELGFKFDCDFDGWGTDTD